MRSMAGPESTAWLAQAYTPLPRRCVKGVDGLHQRAGGVDDVVDDEAGLALHVADHVHHFGDVDVGAALVHNGQRRAHLLRKESRARSTPPASGETTVRLGSLSSRK
jgi:hypothetical protein